MKILIVDDEQLARDRLHRHIQELDAEPGSNYEIIEAENGLIAIEQTEQNNPDIARQFCELIYEYNKQDHVLVASFHNRVLKEFRKIAKDIAVATPPSQIRSFYLLNKPGLSFLFKSDFQCFESHYYW